MNTENCINTVFEESHYLFFQTTIAQTIEYLMVKNVTVTLEEVHSFLMENVWLSLGIEGIIYDDKPVNATKVSKRIYSKIPPLYYTKRIQVLLFDLKTYEILSYF